MTTLSPFASRSVPVHLVRGAGAASLVAFAIWLLSAPGILTGIVAVATLAGAVALLRGCPLCWLVGLFETIAHRTRRDHLS